MWTLKNINLRITSLTHRSSQIDYDKDVRYASVDDFEDFRSDGGDFGVDGAKIEWTDTAAYVGFLKEVVNQLGVQRAEDLSGISEAEDDENVVHMGGLDFEAWVQMCVSAASCVLFNSAMFIECI
jgi:hypothetical protein